MKLWFTVCLTGFILVLGPYFLSLEHQRLKSWLGEKGREVGDALGIMSGWVFFGFWIGLWFSPQNQLMLGYPLIKVFRYTLTSFSVCVSVLFIIPAFWLGLKGVSELGLKVSETHRPVKVVSTGVYGVVRHPQYLSGILGHLGVSVLLGSRDALLVTPIVLLAVYLLCWKEEKELIKEFGLEYKRYQDRVPMFIPKLRR
jgi:protein-S-isoprenylcysteine O-methyltransferase Ste14